MADSLRLSNKYAEAKTAYSSYLTLSDFDSKLAGKLNYYALGYLVGFGKKKRAATRDIWPSYAAWRTSESATASASSRISTPRS